MSQPIDERGGVARSQIVVTASVHCARCRTRCAYQDTSRSQMAYWLRQDGWSDTSREGWVCGFCRDVAREQDVARRQSP